MHSFMLTEKIIKLVNAFEILTLITRVHVWFVYYNVYCSSTDCLLLFWSLNHKCFSDTCSGYRNCRNSNLNGKHPN